MVFGASVRAFSWWQLARRLRMVLTTFRSLRWFNFRVWTLGAMVSNVGTWMQRTAQDWLVLTQLTQHSATALGVVMGLQFGPQLLLPWSGYAADRFDRCKLLIATQLAMCILSLALGLLSVAGVIRSWQVYLLTFLSGCVSAMDAPARQTFVSDLVGEKDLANAVALNSMSFNIACMLGPAIVDLVIAAVGCGWAFLSNAASFAAVLASLRFLRRQELHQSMRVERGRGNLAKGFRYVWSHPDLKAIMWMLCLIGTFGLNFPIFISTMSIKVFHGDASQYGALTGTMAVGTVLGALLAAGRERPHFGLLWLGAGLFGGGFVLAMFTPVAWMFGVTLVIIGVSALTFTNATSSLLQLSVWEIC